MRDRIKSRLLAIAAVGLFAVTVQAEKSDAWITAKVKSSLAAHKNVSAFATDVDTRDGVVTLKGEAETRAEKELAGVYAKKVEGVREVRNMITVKGEAADDGAPERGLGDEALAGIGNAALDARVKSALTGNKGTSALRTKVTAKDGRVTLEGTARSQAERDLAEEVAKSVEGVLSVDNKIKVER